MVVVGATTPAGQVASYSNQLGSAKWGLVAPGGAADGDIYDDIVSTWAGNEYATAAGTSMAAAHVSGALALLLSQGLSPSDAVQRLLVTAAPCPTCGHGRLDAAAAVGASAAPVLRAPAAASSPEPGPAKVVTESGRASVTAPAAPARPARAPVVVPVNPAPTAPAAASAPAPALAEAPSPPPAAATPSPVPSLVAARPASAPSRVPGIVAAAALLAVVSAALALGVAEIANASRGRRLGT
jgi:subtilisin family serine protease